MAGSTEILIKISKRSRQAGNTYRLCVCIIAHYSIWKWYKRFNKVQTVQSHHLLEIYSWTFALLVDCTLCLWIKLYHPLLFVCGGHAIDVLSYNRSVCGKIVCNQTQLSRRLIVYFGGEAFRVIAITLTRRSFIKVELGVARTQTWKTLLASTLMLIWTWASSHRVKVCSAVQIIDNCALVNVPLSLYTYNYRGKKGLSVSKRASSEYFVTQACISDKLHILFMRNNPAQRTKISLLTEVQK